MLLTIYRAVLTWISIYWFSRAGPVASIRIYYEVINEDPENFIRKIETPIPVGHSYFPKEIAVLPRRFVVCSFVIHTT